MTEQDLERLQQAVTRLREAQEEAVYTCQEALASSAALETTAIESAEDEARSFEVVTHLTGAREDVLAILDAASDDVRSILEGGKVE
jgi:hypothetical protein